MSVAKMLNQLANHCLDLKQLFKWNNVILFSLHWSSKTSVSDPDFKNPDPDPSVFCLGLSISFLANLRDLNDVLLLGFGRTWPKKDDVESAKYEEKVFFYLFLQFLEFFFMDPDFPDQIRVFCRSGSGLRKKSLIRTRTKGPGSETLLKTS